MSTNPIISQIYILWRHPSLRYWKCSNVFFFAACVADCINEHLFSKFYESPLFSALKGYQFSTVFPFKRNPVYELLLYAPFTHLPRKLRWVPPLFCSHFFTLLACLNDFLLCYVLRFWKILPRQLLRTSPHLALTWRLNQLTHSKT